MATPEDIKKIADKVFSLDSPKIEESRRQQISDFLGTTINGDAINDFLAINANLSKEREGVLVYVLTDKRIIKISIDAKENSVQSSDLFLHRISTGWEIKEGERTEVRISSEDGNFSLRYPPSNQEITEFFKKVDQARVQRAEAHRG